MASRRKAREQAFQILYLIDLSGVPPKEALNFFRSNFESEKDDFDFVSSLVEGTTSRRDELDQLLEGASDNWKISRMPRVDRNILRLAAFELVGCPETPGAVVMDEAVELAKRFGETKSPPFINGILDRIFRDWETAYDL